MPDDLTFDLNSASWRHAVGDETMFVEALADRLQKSLPGLVEVSRDHRLFAKTHHVEKIMVTLGDNAYILLSEGQRFVTRRAKVVRGVVLSSKEIPMTEWLTELSSMLGEYAKEHHDARRALEDFLL